MTAWRTLKLAECIERVPRTPKIQKKRFKETGRFPIVSQEKGLVNGYWDDENDVVRVNRPAVIFGDHTQVVKLVDFDFVVGADGVKVLKPKSFLVPEYFYYFLLGNPVKALGYARHFRLLKDIDVAIPPLPEQKRIVAILDEAFAGIATAVANTEKNLANARELFESYLRVLFDRICRESGTVKLGDVCKTGSGGTPLKSERRFYEDGKIPWLLSGEVSKREITESSKFISEDGLKNSAAKVFPVNTVLVAMYGATAGQAGILRFASATNQAVCGVYPNDRFLPEFLYYNFLYRSKELVATASGNAQPNISQIKIKNVVVPTLPRSDQVAASEALESLSEAIHGLVENYQRKHKSLAELRQSLLQMAFSGELTTVPQDEIEDALA